LIISSIALSDAGGQNNSSEKFIQITGIISDTENNPVQNVNIISFKLRTGTISDRSGIYSIISTPGDTILFSAMGFKKTHLLVPEVIEGRHYTNDITLYNDTIAIEDVTILPWKSYEEFKQAMTQPRPEDTDLNNMKKNIESIYISMDKQIGIRISPEAGFRYAMMQNFNTMSTKNQYPVNNLLNPFAWASFIKGVKGGLLKNDTRFEPVTPRVKIKKKKERKKD
jgi:signal peptidase I